MPVMSGHGSTLAFGTTTTFAPGYTSIGGFGATRETLPTSGLSTTGAETTIGGDLFQIGEFSSRFLFDPATLATGEAGCIDDLLFDSGAVSAAETATITYPAAGSSCAGTADVTGFEMEELATNTIIAASITVKYQDWPTFSDAT